MRSEDHLNPTEIELSPEVTGDQRYQCGTLRYTLIGLFALFFWLLWGDFIWTLMDGAVPGIIPLKLQTMGASDTVNQVLNKSIVMALTFVLAPVIGVASDRHRGPRGRRIPFLFWSTPFVGLFLILLGLHENLTSLMLGTADHLTLHFGLWNPELTRRALSLWIFGAVFTGYDVANTFVNTVYWYLFNDVVPPLFMSRFLSFFRVTSILAGGVYKYWIQPHALDHFRQIFVTAGIVYVAGFMLMCIFVKEGDYPPPAPLPPDTSNVIVKLLKAMKTCAADSLTAPIYWFFFLHSAFDLLSMMAGNFQQIAFVQSMHLTLEQLGMIGVYTMVPTIVLQLAAGWFSDRWGPMHVYVGARWTLLLGAVFQLVWIVKDFGPTLDLRLLYVLQFTFLPINALADAATLPMYMQLLPRARYGQFSSANAMFRSLVAIFGALAAGLLFDLLGRHERIAYWHYRYNAAWVVVFQLPALFFMTLMYRRWKAMGGQTGYSPP